MKACKLLVSAMLFVAWLKLPAQLQNHSFANFTFIDVLNYVSYHTDAVHSVVKQNIDNGRLTIYYDSQLKTPIAYQDFNKLTEFKRVIQVPNPMNPDDIYDLIDTFVYDEQRLTGFALRESGVVEYWHTEGFTFYSTYKSLKKLLDSRTLNTLEFFIHNNLKVFDDRELIALCRQLVKNQGVKLYNYGINKQFPAYINDSLTTTYTPDEIKERVAIIENRQHQNPKNPGDIYDLIDSTFVYDFNPDTIKILRVHFYWENKNEVTEAKLFAIAPLFHPSVAGLKLPPTSIFLIKSADYLKTLNPTEKRFWLHFYSFLLQNRSFYEDFNIYNQSDFSE